MSDHHWRETETSAELLVDGTVRAWVMLIAPSEVNRWLWGLPLEPPQACVVGKRAAQAAAERALGMAGQDVAACSICGLHDESVGPCPRCGRPVCAIDAAHIETCGGKAPAPPVNDFDPELPRCPDPVEAGSPIDYTAQFMEGLDRLAEYHQINIEGGTEPNDSESPKGSTDDRQRPLRAATTVELYAELHRRHLGLLEAITTPHDARPANPPDAAEAALLQRMGHELIGRGMGDPAGQCYGRLLGLVGEALGGGAA